MSQPLRFWIPPAFLVVGTCALLGVYVWGPAAVAWVWEHVLEVAAQ